MKSSSIKFKALQLKEAEEEVSKEANKDFDATSQTQLLAGNDEENVAITVSSTVYSEDGNSQIVSASC